MALSLPGGPDTDPARQQKFDRLAQGMPGFGGLSVEIRFGVSSVTFTASTISSTVTVQHGLGRAPASIALTPVTAAAIGATVKNGTITSGAFDAQAFSTSAVSGTLNFYWVAIG